MKKLLVFLTIPLWLPIALVVGAVAVAVVLFAILALLALLFLTICLPIVGIVGAFLACAFIFSDFFSFAFFMGFALLLLTIGRTLWWLVVFLTRTMWVIIGRKNELKPPKKRNWKRIGISCAIAAIILAIAVGNNAKTALYVDKSGLHLEQNLQTYSRHDFPDGFNSLYINTVGQNVEIIQDGEYFVETWSRKSEPAVNLSDGYLAIESYTEIKDISFDVGWGDFREQNLIRVHAPSIRNIQVVTDYASASMKMLEMAGTVYTLESSRGRVKFDGKRVSSPFTLIRNDADYSVSIVSRTGDIELDLYGKLMEEGIYLPEELL